MGGKWAGEWEEMGRVPSIRLAESCRFILLFGDLVCVPCSSL